jgi:hypothetical protein
MFHGPDRKRFRDRVRGMARKQARLPEMPNDAGENVDDLVASARSESKKKHRPKLTFPLTDEGRVDLGALTGDRRAQLETLLKDEGLANEIGARGAAPPVQLPPLVVDAIAQACSTLELALILKITKGPREIVEPIAVFSPQERAALVPALAEVLNKYGSALLSRYGAEIALLTVWATITMSKVQAVRDAIEKKAPAPTLHFDRDLRNPVEVN